MKITNIKIAYMTSGKKKKKKKLNKILKKKKKKKRRSFYWCSRQVVEVEGVGNFQKHKQT